MSLLYPGPYAGSFYGFAPSGGVSPTYPTVHAIYFKTTSIVLTWAQVSAATLYQIQVASTPDFSGTLIANTTVTAHQHSFTDTGTNNTKRWWRWRASYDSGTSYDTWSEVASYWVNTAGAENVNLSYEQWAIINPSPVTDRFVFTDFPQYHIVPQHQFRLHERNRLGTLLSDYITIKNRITLAYDSSLYLAFAQFRELRRFNEEVKTFFIATFKDGDYKNPVPNIWQVKYEADPDLSMVAAGRGDLYIGSLTFEEV